MKFDFFYFHYHTKTILAKSHFLLFCISSAFDDVANSVCVSGRFSAEKWFRVIVNVIVIVIVNPGGGCCQSLSQAR